MKKYRLSNQVDEEKYADQVKRMGGLCGSVCIPKLRTTYRAQGSYEEFGEDSFYLCDWAFSDETTFTRLHYEKGDIIGRGYGKIKVLKPFNFYLIYDSYKNYKVLDHWHCRVYAPALGYTIYTNLGYNYPEAFEGESEKDFAERHLMWHFHRREDCRLHEGFSHIDKYLKCEKRVEDRLINIDKDDLVKDCKGLYDEILASVKVMFYNATSQNKRAVIPEGLDEAVGNLKIGDFIEYGTMDVDRYVARHNWMSGKQERRQYKPFDGYLLKEGGVFGKKENYEKFAKVFEALTSAGLNPIPYKQADKRANAAIANEAYRWNKRKRRIMSNIASLDTAILHEIVYQWNEAQRGNFNTISVGGKDYFLTKEMSLRKSDSYEENRDLFFEALYEQGFRRIFSESETTVAFACNISKFLPQQFDDMYFAHHDARCTLEIEETYFKKGGREINLSIPNPNRGEHRWDVSVYYALFKDSDRPRREGNWYYGTFTDTVGKIVKELSYCLDKTVEDVIDGKCYADREVCGDALMHAARQQFALALKRFLEKVEQKTAVAAE